VGADKPLPDRAFPRAPIAAKRQQKARRFRAGLTISVCTFGTISIRIGQVKTAFAPAFMPSKSHVQRPLTKRKPKQRRSAPKPRDQFVADAKGEERG
jgi:hypothetical protein